MRVLGYGYFLRYYASMEQKIEIRPGRIMNVTLHKNPTSDTTVFLVHGLGGRGQQWREQINPLKEKFNLVIPDLLGQGKSEKPFSKTSNLYTFTEFNQDLQKIFDQLATNKNLIIGHSYGGALATSLVFHNKSNVNKLILVSPLPCSPLKVPFVYYLPAFMLEWLRPTLEKQFLRLAFDLSSSPTLIAEEAQASRANPIKIIKSIITGMKKMPHLDVATLTTPTLIILGEHDKLIPPVTSEQFYNALPHHRFETIMNAAHMGMLEKPDQFNKLMMEFLTQ